MLRRTAVGILIFLVLVIGALGTLLGTASGLSFLLKQVNDLVPGRLAIAEIEGGLFGRLQLRQVTYQDDVVEAGADEVIVRWLPGELLQGRFHLVELSAVSPRYSQLVITETPSETKAAGTEPFTLPDISLPIEIRLDKVDVQNFRYQSAPDAEPIEVTRWLLIAGWNADGIALDTLELEMPGIGLTTKGTLEPRGHYPIDLRTRLSVSLPGVPKTEAQGHIHGNLEKLLVEQDLTGDVQAVLSASASDALGAFRWDAVLNLAALRLQAVAPDFEGKVAGTLSAQGDLEQVNAAGRLRLEDAATVYAPWHADLKLGVDLKNLGVAIDRLAITRPESPLELTLTGTADTDFNVDIKGRWQALQWPPSGAARFSSERGTLDLKGKAEDYRLMVQTRLAGSDIPPGSWEIAGHGTQERFEIEKLEGKTLQGTLGVTGTLAWAPTVTWDAALKADGVNPGVQYPEWPGKLDLLVTSKGVIQEGKRDITAVIDTLKGTLRERPLDGAGTVKMVGEEITIDAVALASGAASLNADGRLGQQSDLAWAIDIPKMVDLLPNAAGAVRGKGRIQGPLTEPTIDGTLSVNGVNYQDMTVATLAADVLLDLSDKTPSRVAVRSQDLRLGDERIAALEATADGRKKGHRLVANVEHAMGKLSLQLAGAYDEVATIWKGSLEDLGLQSTDLGTWALQQPVGIVAAPDDVETEEICLTREAGVVCAQAAWHKQKGTASLNARDLQLSWLQKLLPPEVASLDGALGLRVDARLDEKALVDAELTLTPGAVAIYSPVKEIISVQHQGGRAKAELGNERLAVVFNLDIGDDGFKGNLYVPRAPFDEDPMAAPLDGDIDLQFRQLQLFAGLLPMIRELNGEVLANLKLGGKLGNPTVKGEAGIVVQQLQIPDAGLALRDIEVKARSDDGKRIRLDGGVTSGKGRLELDGNIELDPDNNWPMQVSLSGEDFQALNLPDMNARIATDLTFNSTATGMLLQGSVDIPKAYIALDDVPEGATSPSADVIVETDDKLPPPDKGAPFAMRVTVGLGDDVRFRGFGLKAYFAGKLTVNQAPGEFPSGSGQIRIKEGTYKAYGQDLVIKRGIVAYSGGRIDDPGLNIRAAREANVDLGNGMVAVTAGVDVTGTAKKPTVSAFSNPVMEERDAIAILLTGNTARNIGKGGGSIGVGAEVRKNLSVDVRYDPSTSIPEVVTKYRFNRKLHVEATTSSEANAGDVFYTLEFD